MPFIWSPNTCSAHNISSLALSFPVVSTLEFTNWKNTQIYAAYRWLGHFHTLLQNISIEEWQPLKVSIIHNFVSVALVICILFAILFQQTKCRIRAFSRVNAVLGNVQRLLLFFVVVFVIIVVQLIHTHAKSIVCLCVSLRML